MIILSFPQYAKIIFTIISILFIHWTAKFSSGYSSFGLLPDILNGYLMTFSFPPTPLCISVRLRPKGYKARYQPYPGLHYDINLLRAQLQIAIHYFHPKCPEGFTEGMTAENTLHKIRNLILISLTVCSADHGGAAGESCTLVDILTSICGTVLLTSRAVVSRITKSLGILL